ncbi:ubiquitin-conjugating enzyme E2 U isoform X5 [Tamandua tetradactyla]|uniref:ubiquitin-conjugating enzyme E2 U isoform X5 n=1 Tax=Tamandua tetradactyla TaxID=48850 RepID=UPI0040543679
MAHSLAQSRCEAEARRCLVTRRRAYLLLLRDFQELKENNYKGITASPVSEDMMEWKAEIEGLQNSIWHVDQHTGQPCIDFLDNPNKWSTSYTLSSILLTLQVMLSNPGLENPVNLEAAELLIKNESLYNTAVLRLFKQPLPWRDDDSGLLKEPHTFTRSIKAIPFNDYYKTWSGIATSKATECYRAPLLNDPDFMRSYYKWKKIELKHPKEWSLKFAASMSRLNRENNRPHRASHPTERTYLCPTPDQTSLGSPTERDFVTKIDRTGGSWNNETSPEDEAIDSSWEEEVDDLVTWASTLNTNIFED